MKLEDYSTLKEIHSLDNMIKVHADKIAEESKRLDFINKKRLERENELKSLTEKLTLQNKEVSDKEKTLFDLESKLERTLEHLPMATNEKEVHALENEKNELEPRVESLQEEILDDLQKVEEIEELIEKANGFLRGSLETIEEIKKEIQLVTESEEKPISNYNDRINSLLEQLPSYLKEVFLKTREKFKYQRPLVRIINHNCEQCHFRIDQQAMDRVESCQGVECCSSCGRLFIPLES